MQSGQHRAPTSTSTRPQPIVVTNCVRERGLLMFPQNKGRFYHDGRFQTLLDVVNSYDARFNLELTSEEKHDLVEYLKSL